MREGEKMAKRTIHVFGENVIDLEGHLGLSLPGGVSLTPDNLTLPLTMGIRVTDEQEKVKY